MTVATWSTVALARPFAERRGRAHNGMVSSDWGPPPWRVDFDLEGRPLPGRASVAVIGAGLTGLGATYALGRRGRDDRRWRQVERISIARGEAATVLATLETRVRGLHPALAAVAIERRFRIHRT